MINLDREKTKLRKGLSEHIPSCEWTKMSASKCSFAHKFSLSLRSRKFDSLWEIYAEAMIGRNIKVVVVTIGTGGDGDEILGFELFCDVTPSFKNLFSEHEIPYEGYIVEETRDGSTMDTVCNMISIWFEPWRITLPRLAVCADAATCLR